MNRRLRLLAIIFLVFPSYLYSQSLFDSASNTKPSDFFKMRGFARAGFFINELSGKPAFSSGFSDLALKITAEDGKSYKAYADLRFRYGMEFGSQANDIRINEAYISWYKSWLEISAGQQIIKWSKSDFFRTQDRMNPRNDLYRTFDDSDRDLGNMMLRMNLYPKQNISLEILYLPFERPTALSTDIMDIPALVSIKNVQELRIDEHNGSWALNMGLNLKNIDIGLSFYSGSNPMPMICFDSLIVPQQVEDTPAELKLEAELSRVSMFSSNMEIVLGKTIFRGEFTYLNTDLSGSHKDFVPFSELIWTAGIEPSLGNFRVLLEYQGKHIIDFEESDIDPVFPETISLPPGMPPEVLEEMIILQVSSFNRLYNYQLKESSHSLGLRLSFDNGISTLKPELNIIYNLSTEDLMINPLLRFNPVDNLTMITGADIFRGKKDSLYDLLDKELTSVYLGLRVNF